MTKPKPLPAIGECVECGAGFTPTRHNQKTCSADCAHKRHLGIHRSHARQKYVPCDKSPRDAVCPTCGVGFVVSYRQRMKRFCTKRCAQAAGAALAAERRSVPRLCVRCGAPVERKPGKPVCAGCRVDPRVRASAHEKRRRAQNYGLTVDELDRMLRRQRGQCALCGTTEPGKKGLAIDHDHVTGQVRALLCGRCNTGIGLLQDDPELLAKAATYVRSHRQLRLIS